MLDREAKLALGGLLAFLAAVALSLYALGGPLVDQQVPTGQELKDTIKAVIKDTIRGAKMGGDQIVEISIDDSGITIRTEDGKQYSARVNGKNRILISEDGIIIGDMRIPEGLEELDKQKRLEKLKDLGIVIEAQGEGKDIVRWGSDIIVGEEEVVTGDIVALGGDVTVKGTVDGSVVALGGDIYVTSGGYIRQGATAVGGKIEVEPGGQIHREEVELPLRVKLFGQHLGSPAFRFSSGRLLFAIAMLVLISIAIVVVLSLMPRNVERIKLKISEDFLKSFLFGYLIAVGAVVALVFLVVTVIGIPVAILLPIFLFFMLAVGLTATCLFFGEKLKGPMNIATTSPIYLSFLGAVAIHSFLIAGAILGVLRPLGFLGGLLTAVWVIVFFFLIIPASLGGVVLARFGAAPSAKGQTVPQELTPSSPPSEENENGSGSSGTQPG